MARRGRSKEYIFPLDSAEALDEWVEKTNKVLLVVDVHKSWCGRCIVIDPAVSRLAMEMDEFESRVKIFSIDQDLLSDEQKEKWSPPQGCKPMFLVFKHKAVIGTINGANAPELLSMVEDNVFPKEDD